MFSRLLANMGLPAPTGKAKQEANHLPANRQMAANDPGLMVSEKLFTPKNTPGPF
jgi:hypothetical protein